MGCNFCTTSEFFGGKGRMVTFLERGEDVFRVMCEAERASGARAFIAYGLTEAAVIAVSCATPDAPDDLHLCDSRYAMVQHARWWELSHALR